MTVTIEPELEAVIARRISEGAYPTAEKMVSAALRRFLSEPDTGDSLTPGATYYVHAPLEAYEAAAQLSAFLEREKAAQK